MSMHRRGERGQSSLEFVAIVPIVLVIFMVVVQGFSLLYSAVGAGQAARDAARAYAKSDSLAVARAAAIDSLPGGVTLVDLDAVGPGHGVRIVARAPKVWPLGDRDLTAHAVLP